MAKKIDYASLYTLRADGRYMGYWRDANGQRHAAYDRDPAKLYAKIEERERQATAALTVAEVAERWSEKRFPELAYKSVEAYKPVFRRLTARFGEAVLGDVQTFDVAAWLKTLAAQGYAKRTVQLHRDMLSQIYNFAIGEGLTTVNPCDHVTMPRNLPEGTRGIASDDALAAVLQNKDKPFGLFALICYFVGLRRGEALGLKYEDVDRSVMTIRVRRSVYFEGNVPHLKEPKTKQGRRDVVLPAVVAEALPRGKGFIFAQPDGQLLTRDQYRKAWQRYCEEIGFAITAHQLRHGYATLLYEAGVADKDAQEQLGHANIELTRDVYTHITKRQRSRTAAKINKYVEDFSAKKDETDAVVDQILDLLDGRDAGAILARVAAKIASSQG